MPPVIAVIGRISDWKGQDVLVRALAEPALREIGTLGDVASVYGAADVIAVPSTAPDPLPGTAIEAAAAGCAVVASAHGGLPEIIRDRCTGRLVAAGDAPALARAARELIEDRTPRERVGAAAARDVRERYAPERLLAAIHALYGSVLRS